MTQDGLELVILRNNFYRDNYRKAVLSLLLVLLVNCALAFGIVYKLTHPPEPQYFAATSDGRLINVHPLSDPVVSDDFVLQWSSTAVRQTFALDYVHWRDQLQGVSDYFSADGWKWFLQALQGTNNLKTLVDLQMVSSAKITGAPQLLDRAVLNGRYAWKISIPVLITYTSSTKNFNLPATVTLVVIRMPITEAPARIAINNFIVSTGGSS